jgi:predicted nucleotidyltransferase
MMNEIALIYSTHNSRIDHILKAIIGYCELLFPERIRGYYLQGSYATGDATSVSDIDMTLLFREDFVDEEERQRAWQVDTLSEWLVGRQLDIIPFPESRLSSSEIEDVVLIEQFREGARLLYGEESRSEIVPASQAVYVQSCMLAAFRAISWHHHHPKPFPIPLIYHDQNDESFGFNQFARTIYDEKTVGTERLVHSIVRIAGALVTLKTGQVVHNKRKCVHVYTDGAVDKWAALVADVFHWCYDKWQYQIPKDREEREKLRRFYEQTLNFENYFLSRYYDLLSKDALAEDIYLRQTARKQFAEIFNFRQEGLKN